MFVREPIINQDKLDYLTFWVDILVKGYKASESDYIEFGNFKAVSNRQNMISSVPDNMTLEIVSFDKRVDSFIYKIDLTCYKDLATFDPINQNDFDYLAKQGVIIDLMDIPRYCNDYMSSTDIKSKKNALIKIVTCLCDNENFKESFKTKFTEYQIRQTILNGIRNLAYL